MNYSTRTIKSIYSVLPAVAAGLGRPRGVGQGRTAPWRAIRGTRERGRAPSGGSHRQAILLALAGGAFFGLDLALYNTAVLMTTAATATLLGNNAPIFVGIGSWLFFGRRPARRFWAGLALALLGGVLVVVTAIAGGGAGSVRGDLLAVAASMFFAAYMFRLPIDDRSIAGHDQRRPR